MAFPKIKLSSDSALSNYATATDSILTIKSMLFADAEIQFLGFLTDLSQTFDSTWNTEQVFGRNDPIAIFQGTKRTISIAFSVVAGTQDEARDNLAKIDQLASFMYPAYKKVSGPSSAGLGDVHAASYMSGSPLMKVKFSNLVNSSVSGLNDGLMGYVDSLSITPVLDAGTFVGGAHYPKVHEISFNLNVLHQATPGWASTGGWLGRSGFFGSKFEIADGQKLAERGKQTANIYNQAQNLAAEASKGQTTLPDTSKVNLTDPTKPMFPTGDED